ncbi:hypothetical protein B0O99DRAFT_626380, partial [Bisporella sp. PMI_857]
MSSVSAIRYIAASKRGALGSIQVQCHVKPGASKQREGISHIGASAVEVCVSARAKEGEANKAVRELFSSVLKIPKSDVEIIRGLKSRDKTVAITGVDASGDEERLVSTILQRLERSI